MFIPMTAYTPKVSLEVGASTQNYVLLSEVTAALGGAPSSALVVEVDVSAGIIIGSASTGSYAFDARNLPAGSEILITMGAGSYIVGAGGQGGLGGHQGGGYNGAAGGPGFITDLTTVISGSGTIAGGGGGGGGGTGGDTCAAGCDFHGGSGGGGAGNIVGPANGPNGSTCIAPASSPGTLTAGGLYALGCTNAGGTGGRGGYGGDLGEAGDPGVLGSPSTFSPRGSPGVGGAGGIAITGFSHCTVGVGISVLINTTG